MLQYATVTIKPPKILIDTRTTPRKPTIFLKSWFRRGLQWGADNNNRWNGICDCPWRNARQELRARQHSIRRSRPKQNGQLPWLKKSALCPVCELNDVTSLARRSAWRGELLRKAWDLMGLIGNCCLWICHNFYPLIFIESSGEWFDRLWSGLLLLTISSSMSRPEPRLCRREFPKSSGGFLRKGAEASVCNTWAYCGSQ